MHRTLRSLLLSVAVLVSSVSVRAQSPPTDLAPRYTAWLEEVALLITPKERRPSWGSARTTSATPSCAASGRCATRSRRHPSTSSRSAGSHGPSWRERRFGNLTDDRARMMLFNGEPAEVFQARCDVLLPVELWSYPGTEHIRGSFTLAFVSRGGSPKRPLPALVAGRGGRVGRSRSTCGRGCGTRGGALAAIAELCPRGEDIGGPAGRVDRLGPRRDGPPARAQAERGVALDFRLLLDRRARGRRVLPRPGGPLLPRPLRQPHGGAGPGHRAEGSREARADRGRARRRPTPSWWTAR